MKIVTRIAKNRKEIAKITSYRLKFIDRIRFTANALSNLVTNLAEEIHKIKCNNESSNKKCKTCGIKYIDCD